MTSLLRFPIAFIAAAALWWITWQHSGILQALVAAITPVVFLTTICIGKPGTDFKTVFQAILPFSETYDPRLAALSVPFAGPAYAALFMPPGSSVNHAFLATVFMIPMLLWICLIAYPKTPPPRRKPFPKAMRYLPIVGAIAGLILMVFLLLTQGHL